MLALACRSCASAPPPYLQRNSAISERRDSGLATMGLASAVVVQVGVPEEEDDKRLVGPGFMLADRNGD